MRTIKTRPACFSALQRAEIAEIWTSKQFGAPRRTGFSALQRAEIAEIARARTAQLRATCFSALQRAEIAEMQRVAAGDDHRALFQCSSTSRNC